MSWNSIGKNFCEGLLDGYPENFNAFTAILFILPLGLWGLLKSNLKNDLTRFIYVFLSLNGIGSFLLHYYGYRFYGLLDTITLNLVGWILNYFVLVILLNTIKQKVNLSEFIYHITLDIIAFIDISFCLFFILNDSVNGKPWGINVTFAEGFGICQIFTTVCCVILCILHKDELKFIIYNSIGLVYLLLAVIIWLSTEPRCLDGDYQPFYKYTHGLWHIFSIHASHIIIQSLFYINIIVKGEKAELENSNNYFFKILFFMFPITLEVN
jgi:hypothetical protein